ncbi:transglutaminase-like domain-containing protein [Blastopirellula retiformator]|uniref:Transglutaminase-like superfamily protein n=1 Tax=Blastopirellula retiformator TaxID=2527970 RepID=A0A5C5V1Y4_9BACT|nr:transglutaminase family protein [Blastopirellula retiformator]TWT31807.1 Transglutaminase-like superfamily protein [Blastopirellula retiformator]
MPRSTDEERSPASTRLEWLTIAAALLGVFASNIVLMQEAPLVATFGASAAWMAVIVIGFLLASRQRRMLPPRVQAAVMCAALLVPLARIFTLESDGRIDLLMLEGLRNLCAASAIFTFDPVRRRATLFAGTLLALFVFTFDGSLLVAVCVLAQLCVVTLWLTANDQAGFRVSAATAGSWRPDFVVSCLLLVLLGFVASTIAYPADQTSQGELIDRYLKRDVQELDVEEVSFRLEEQDEVLEEASDKKYGATDGEAEDEVKRKREGRKSFSTRRKAPKTGGEFRTLFALAGDQVRHIPTTRFNQFDGIQWQPEKGRGLPSASTQISQQEGLQKLVNRQDLDFSQFAEDVDVNSEQFLEQLRSLASQSLMQQGAGTLTPQLRDIPPDKLQALMLEAPQMSSTATLLFTPYDVQALSETLKKNPALAWKLIARGSQTSDGNDALLRDLQELRANHEGPILPPEMAALVAQWTAGTEPGWEQIMAVVHGLRSHAVYDPMATIPTTETDSVRYFLIESRRGPDYMFASSAVVLLRSLGYPSRLVGGYYAHESRRSWMTGETSIREDDVHYWAQVALADKLWVDIEPTPGFEIPAAKSAVAQASWWNVASTFLLRYGAIIAVSLLVIMVVIIFLRRKCHGAWIYWRWRWSLRRSPPELVARTHRLIQYRLHLAGCALQAGASFQTAVLPLAPHEKTLRRFAALGQEAVYCKASVNDPAHQKQLRQAATDVVAWLTPRRIQAAVGGAARESSQS